MAVLQVLLWIVNVLWAPLMWWLLWPIFNMMSAAMWRKYSGDTINNMRYHPDFKMIYIALFVPFFILWIKLVS